MATGRERHSNLRRAREELERRLAAMEVDASLLESNRVRKVQVGCGARGDKRRTYRFQEDRVRDHFTGKSARISEVMQGRFDALW